MEQEEEENMCDAVLYADPGRRSRLSIRVVDVGCGVIYVMYDLTTNFSCISQNRTLSSEYTRNT